MVPLFLHLVIESVFGLIIILPLYLQVLLDGPVESLCNQVFKLLMRVLFLGIDAS